MLPTNPNTTTISWLLRNIPSPSQSIHVPSIKVIRAHIACRLVGSTLRVVGRARGHICFQFDVKSQFVIVHLRRLQQTAHLHGTLSLLLLGRLGRLLAFFGE